LAVRIRVRLRILDKEITTTALVNTGFETDEPQILVPDRLLIANGVDLSRLHGTTMEYGTAGGTIVMFVARRACRVALVEPDRVVGDVVADLVVSPVEREVLISDALGEELGIVILSLKRGLWRFEDDPQGRIREPYPPQPW